MFGTNLFSKLWAITLIAVILVAPITVQGAVKDTDLDGLTDEAEQTIYFTNWNNPDTDFDGVSDGQEVIDGTNPLDPSDSVPLELSQKMQSPLPQPDSLPWYIGRASGIFAFILLTVVVVNGLLISTRTVSQYIPPPLNYEMHRFFAWLSLFALIGHIASFTFDPFMKLTWAEGFTPFLLQRQFLSGLGYELRVPITLGIFALYGLITLVLTSYFRQKLSLKTWRTIHYLSFFTYLLFLGHGISAGTDSKEWWMIWIYGFSATLVTLLIIVRIRASLQKRRLAALTTPPTPVAPRDPFAGLTRPLPAPPLGPRRNTV